MCPAFRRERPTSPSTEEAIQGMLSMAGLLCSTKQEKVSSPQEPWWSSHSQRSPQEVAQHQRRLQGDKSPMDSQGNSSSEAWDNQGLPSPETDYQYCDPSSMSPPLHPSKRHAPNPPPISNQATKGATSLSNNHVLPIKRLQKPVSEGVSISQKWSREGCLISYLACI